LISSIQPGKQVNKFQLLVLLTLITYPPPVYAQSIRVHDPVMIKEGLTYHLFCTGNGITTFVSGDLKTWVRGKPVFSKPPEWAVKTISGFRSSIWAPDISYHNGKFYLYYSVSAFGTNASCIGLAVNKTLDTASADYKWEDLGKVIQSVPGRDMWNAIDPNLIVDEKGTPWLTFGSFWNGIKLVQLDKDFKTLSQPETLYTLASRKRTHERADSSAGDAAIEAPFIFKKGNYYYLFVSWDYCCRGVNSTYKIVVGRSDKVMGPYADKTGAKMVNGGGSLLAEGNTDWYGVGHSATYTFVDNDYIIYHGYDAKDKGRSKLILKELQWDADGWPVIKKDQ
jgi:arabinan endo-1,5-alpha-L-arabinosidase